MEHLKQINRELEGFKDALLYDSDLISAYAKGLGYGRREERFVRIVGLSGARKQQALPGQILAAPKPESVSEQTIRLLSFASAGAALLYLVVVDLLRKRRITGRP